MKTVAVLLVCFVVCLNYVTANELKCIQCHSENVTCSEPTVQCTSEYVATNIDILIQLKADIEINKKSEDYRCFDAEFEKEKGIIFVRGCMYDYVDLCAGDAVQDVSQNACSRCDTDECNNGASSLTLSFGLMVGLVITVKTFLLQ
ncbi:uncharacterized protein LOC129731863 [Wyeomyia smithii]|uniref:uncharacterized protein LOC129731863 n=1 Tax=Wyeomyia smithii TaxID=174621 RepID=UPI0024682122|nr:uncharacterized protein LOC129731863 [Wyeomyia smithii]